METVAHDATEHASKREVPLADQSQLWFDVGDLARRYKTSVRHIHRMADRGQMPWGVKLGHLRRWSRREIEAWETAGCNPVGPPRSDAEGAKRQNGGHHD